MPNPPSLAYRFATQPLTHHTNFPHTLSTNANGENISPKTGKLFPDSRESRPASDYNLPLQYYIPTLTFMRMVEQKYNLASLAGKIITIDGPAGSGKSTTARILAAKLGYQYLDTGAMYRALTHYAMKFGISPADSTKLETLAKNLSIEFTTDKEINRVAINGEDVTDAIRSPEVTKMVSEISAHRGVRIAMVTKQKELGKKGSIVAEGRDTTTVVFPRADIKFYMDATVEQRAQRRVLDLARLGVSTTIDEQTEDIRRRDDYDSNRKESPLTQAKDAYHVDTTKMTIEEQTEHMLNLIVSVLKKT